ncbi:retrovirus-related pol polyprotein from transposon RE1 [Citrus sinensis]|nr:retrovirus-related pol polyprotein from transposon RE1 [Citrus sinensis]
MASSSFNSSTHVSSGTSFTFTTPIKLDRTNYTIWKQQVLSSIRGNGLESYIDESKLCPEQFLPNRSGSGEASGEGHENPDFVAWKRQDQLLLSWIMSSMSLEILSLVVSSQTTLELWKNLEKQFGSESMAKKVHLKMLLSNLRKGSLSMTEYFTKLRTISDGLALAGSPLSNIDLITHLITGLDHSYYPVVVYIEANMLTMDLSEAYAMLLTHEARLENSKIVDNKEAKSNYMANVAQTGNFQKKGNGNNQNNWNKNGGGNWNQNWNQNFAGRGGGYQGQGRGSWNGNPNAGRGFAGGFNNGGGNFNSGGLAGNFNNGNSNAGGFGRGGFGGNRKNFAQGGVMCQICFRYNHTAADCRDRFNRNFAPNFPAQGYHPNQGPKSAYMATSEGVADQGWYLDSGATHHLTNSAQNLTDGNGQGLQITHIGNACLHTSVGSCIYLHNTLCVPKITKNLISVSKLLVDSNITIEFTSDVCFLKDKVKGTLLAQGIVEGGLYKLLSYEESFLPFDSKVQQPSSMVSVFSSHQTCVNPLSVQIKSGFPVSFHASSNVSVSLLHNRLGHPSKHVVQTLLRNSCINISSDNKQQLEFCNACQLGKLHQFHFSATEIKSKNPLELIHTDLWGPASVLSMEGYKYYISFVDDYTRYCWIFPLVLKSDALGIFKPKTYLTAIQDIEPTSVKIALSDQKWSMAMTEEFHALKNNETWTLVPADLATKIVGNKWVFRVKYNPDGSISKYKARLVAKGFHQTYGVDFFETFSPVVKPCTIRIILSLAVMNHWTIRQLDVNNAFLNGVLTEEVFMHQPEGFIDSQHPTYVCKLNKALYGLKQAPRAWYDRLKGSLLQWGFQTSRSDTSLFLKHTGSDVLAVLIYVDDILVTGSSNAQIEEIITLLGSEFALKDLGDFNYFLGLEVTPSSAGLHLSQTKYIGDILQKAHMLGSKGCTTPMSAADKLYKDKGTKFENPSLYRSVIGSLQYVTLTRPDIAFTVNKLSQFLAAPTVLHWQACKRVLRYLQCTADYGIQFYNSKSLSLTAFSDADWGSDPDDRRSVGGYCIFLGSNLVSWSSKKQNVVSRSSAESEYRALALTSSEVLWISYLLQELKVQLNNTPILYCDNKSAEALASNPKYHSRTKHIELDLHFVREHIAKKEFVVEHVSSSDQLADVLTKPLSFDHFAYMRAKLNVCPRP